MQGVRKKKSLSDRVFCVCIFLSFVKAAFFFFFKMWDSDEVNSTPVLQPTKVPQASKVLPPNVLIRIFSLLPVPSLAQVALVSRRFKVLVYDDEIWDSKLSIMLENDTGALAAMLGIL